METIQDFAEHIVRQGASMLDLISRDWRSRVNLDTLDMWSASRCVIGQAFGEGDYHDGIGVILAQLDDAAPGCYDVEVFERLGFVAGRYVIDADEFLDIPADYEGRIYLSGPMLTGAWKTVLSESGITPII